MLHTVDTPKNFDQFCFFLHKEYKHTFLVYNEILTLIKLQKIFDKFELFWNKKDGFGKMGTQYTIAERFKF
jgi:hypothetical protein